MSRFTSTRRRKIAAVGSVVVVAVALTAVAAAYFLGTGSTSSTATVGTSPVGLTLSASVDPTAVYPGKSVPVSITISNAAGHGNVRAGSIAQDGPVTGLPVGCNASWFSFASVPVNQTLLEGGSASVTGALAFTESGTDQSACSAANPVLHVALAS